VTTRTDSGRSKPRRDVLGTDVSGNGSHSQKCVVRGCYKFVNRGQGSVQGWCPSHSARWYRHGDVQADVPLQDRSFPIPIEPLIAYLARQEPLSTRKSLAGKGDAPYRVLQGKHSQAYYRGRRRGGLSIWTADAIACSLGKHPMEVWPDWWELTAV